MKKYLWLTVLLLIIAAGGYLLLNKSTNEIPSLIIRSTDAANSAEVVNAQKAVDFYRSEIEKNPGTIKNYVELAQIFMQLARSTGLDHEYIAKAQSVINTALNKSPNNNEALITKASILLTLHRFDEAKPIAEKVTTALPYYAYAFGVLCDAYVELGEYDKAVAACNKMLSIRPDLSSYSRASYIRELHGQAEAAIDAMKMSANAGVWGSENRAWALYNMANLFLITGKKDTAAFIYKGILEERPNYAYALSGQAKIELLNKNYKQAEELLLKAHSASPVHTFLEQLADLYMLKGDKQKENVKISEVLEEFDNHEAEGYNIDLEYARFCANHSINIDKALTRIKKEYQRRPGNIEVLETYAVLLSKTGRHEQAAEYIKQAMRLNTCSPSIFYHAGEIFYSLSRFDEAAKYFHKAIDLAPYFDMLYAKPGMGIRNKLASMKILLASADGI